MHVSKPILRSLLVLAFGLAAFWYFRDHPIYSTTSYTCSRCRAVERVTRIFSIESRQVEQTDYSRWFTRSHSHHDHHWCWCGTDMNHSGLAEGRACGRQHVIWQLQPDVQRRFVEKATPGELEQFYSFMDSSDAAEQKRGADMLWQKVLE